MSEQQWIRSTRRTICSGAVAASMIGWPPSTSVAAIAKPSAKTLSPQPFTWTEVPPSLPRDSRRYVYGYARGLQAIIVSDADAEAFSTGLVLRVRSGCLDDPEEFEGLAHLAEHVTLRNGYKDIDFDSFSVNGRTKRRTTTFEVFWEEEGQQTKADILSHELDRLMASLKLASSTDPLRAAPISIVRKELLRVNDEMDVVKNGLRTNKRVLELASLSARASPLSSWHRLGRGDKNTLRIDTDDDAKTLAGAVTKFRMQYFEFPATLVVVTSIPMEDTIARVTRAFSQFPCRDKAPQQLQQQARDTPFILGSVPSIRAARGRYSKSRAPAFAIQYDQEFSSLALVWEVDLEACGVDVLTERLQSPLEMISQVLTYPHSRSLASTLRRLRLSPLHIEQNNVVRCSVIDRADSWALWKIEVTLARGSEARWPEVLALAVAAVSQLAKDGVPGKVVSEVQRMTNATRVWSPNDYVNANDIVDDYYKLRFGSTNLGSPSYEGDIDSLVDVVDRVVERLASEFPAITLWTSHVDSLDKDKDAKTLPLPSPLDGLATLVPLKALKIGESSNPFTILRPVQALNAYLPLLNLQFLPRSGNPWVPTSFTRTDVLMEEGVRAVSNIGLEILQLPGLLDPSDFFRLTGSTSFTSSSPLAQVYGKALDLDTEPEEFPFAAMILQLESPLIDEYTKSKAEVLALWRMTFLEVFSEKQEAAALWSNMRLDITFNKAGVQLITSGFAQRLPNFMSSLLAGVLRHSAASVDTFQWDTARRVLKRELSLEKMPLQSEGGSTIISDVLKVFKSTKSARLLMAGDIGRDAAQSCGSDIGQQLAPLLLLHSQRQPVAEPIEDMGTSMRRWKEVLQPPSVSLRRLYTRIQKNDKLLE